MGPPDEQARPDDGERAWLAPEAAPTIESPSTTPTSPIPVAPEADVATAAAPGVDGEVRLPVPLRPMTMGDLLDGGFNVLRARPRIVLGLAAVFVVPVQVVVAWFNRNALEDLETLLDQTLSNAGARPEDSVGNVWASIFAAVGTSVGQALIGASLALLVVAWYSGEQPDGREVLRRLKPRFWSLVGAWFFIHLLEVAGFFTLGIASLVVMTIYLVSAPAIAVEGLGPFKGMSRSSSLAGRRFWPVLGFAIVSGIVATVLGQILGLLPQLVGLLLGPDFGWIALGLGAIITQMVSATVVGAATALLYLDLRIRREGMDVAWAADRLFPLVSADDVRQLADEIVARPEFQQPEPSLIEQVRNWVTERIGDLLNAATGGGAGSIVGVLVLAALVGLVLWMALRLGRTVQSDGRLPGVTIEGVHRRSPAEWRAEAERQEAEGRWKEALRSRYRALVGDLVAEDLLEDVAGRTTGELRADVERRAPDRAESFGAATELFELAWYADRPTGPDENARFRALADRVTGVPV